MLEAVQPWLDRWSSARGKVGAWILARPRLLSHFNLTVKHKVGGRTFRLPIKEGVCAIEGEPWMDKLIARLYAARPGSFVDVGVNLGQTLLKLKALAPDTRYFGFEPNPRCSCYVNDLIGLNRLEGCKVYPFALGERPEVLQLFQGSAADQAASMVAGFRPDDHYSARQYVSVFPGDQVLGGEQGEEFSIIKIDVEGAEREVLMGLRATIDRHRPFILCEVLPVYDLADDTGKFRLARQKDIEAFLRERRYSIQRVGTDGGLTKVDEFGVHGDMSASNYVFVPIERPL